ncbi:Polyketide cyclase [Nitrospira tepida]|uniref:Polyketide cyclase n=1 Tax=Nitrospira tepida TaxID=2973512 RepID=A0AA86T8E2_9BACT|nr:SRPBCC domain-containing protein [Nitrospira tepida]CAI4029738.1 Polyketide cyclase [Nitrospira tepida]
MADIIHRVGIKAGPDKVFRALSTIDGLAGWWTTDTSGVADVGKIISFQFRDPNGKTIGGFDMEVVKQEPAKKVQWKCVKGPEEWIGTDITFDLKQENDFTIVLFGHRKWKESSEFTAHCSTKWAVFLISLKELVETGKGRPSPRDIKIDNWN